MRDTSFTVSWLTDLVTTGEIHYGTDPGILNQTAYDERGATVVDDTHYVTLQGLQPNITYYFDVVSGATTDNNGGVHYSLATGPTLTVPAVDTVYGQVFKEDGVPNSFGLTPAEGAIVHITLTDDDGSGSPDEAAPLSALVDDTGYWYINLSNARTADLSAYFAYADRDWVLLKAQGASDGVGCLAVVTAAGAPVAPLVLNISHCTWSSDIQFGWNHVALPLFPSVPYTAEGACGEINDQGGDVVEVDRWHAAGWDGHICGLPFNDFAVEMGSDYFIKGNAPIPSHATGSASTWTIEEGYEMGGVLLDLQVGWNSIGVPSGPPPGAYTAESLCDEIISEGVMALEIDRWYASGWDGHVCGLPFNDFAIEMGKGYFVKTGSTGTVILSGGASQSQEEPEPLEPPQAVPATEVAVRDLQISNLRDTSVALSWITDEPATGYVLFGEKSASGQSLDHVAYDVRGPAVASKTHYITLTGLVPETTYYFDIVSGAGVDDNSGAHHIVTTGRSLDSPPASDTVYGQVFRACPEPCRRADVPNSFGLTPAAGTIIYLTLRDNDGAGTAGEAMLMSALVDETGYWHTNLGNARLADGVPNSVWWAKRVWHGYFVYSMAGDVVTLVAYGPTGGSAARTVDTSALRPTDPIILGRQFQLYVPLISR